MRHKVNPLQKSAASSPLNARCGSRRINPSDRVPFQKKAPVCQPSPQRLRHSQPKNMRPGPVSRPGIFLRSAEVFVRYISSSDTFSQHFSGQVAAKFPTILEAVSDCLCHAVDTNRNAINVFCSRLPVSMLCRRIGRSAVSGHWRRAFLL
jgi:hypothetical protein